MFIIFSSPFSINKAYFGDKFINDLIALPAECLTVFSKYLPRITNTITLADASKKTSAYSSPF
jgi:hypothetical protein